MHQQPLSTRATHVTRTQLELVPNFFAKFAGVLLGVLAGLTLIGEFVFKGLKKLRSPLGRKEVIYGRRSSAPPVTFEGERRLSYPFHVSLSVEAFSLASI